MKSVVIVDDEYIVVEGIKTVIAREEMEFEVIGCAYNGVDGVELIERVRPQLVITDIRMPGKTGLQMIEELTRKGLQTEYIIISGYREFEYARTALNLGVRGYIDKPITIDSVKEALLDAAITIEEKEEQSVTSLSHQKRQDYEKASETLMKMISSKEYEEGMNQLEFTLKCLKKYEDNLEGYKQECYKLVCLGMGVYFEIKADRKREEHMPSFENVRNVKDKEEMDLFARELFQSIFNKIKVMKTGGLHKTVEKIIQYLDENYSRDIGLAELSSMFDMNYVYLSILFKEEIGMSFVKYLTQIRMEHAKSFLMQGEKVGKVAELTGYSNYRYFCDIFKKYEGMTPSEYKGNVRKVKKP